VGERLAILHRVGVRVEEVADRRHHFIPDNRVEVSELHDVVTIAELTVHLRDRKAVVLARGPRRRSGHAGTVGLVCQKAVPAASRRVDVIGAVEEVDATAPVESVRGVDQLLVDEIELVHLALPVPIVERDRTVERAAPVVGPDAGCDPAVGLDAAAGEEFSFQVAVWTFLGGRFLGRFLRRQAAHFVGLFLRHSRLHGRQTAARLSLGILVVNARVESRRNRIRRKRGRGHQTDGHGEW